MMLGYATGSADQWKNIEPYDEVGGLESALAGTLFSISERLEKHWKALTPKAEPEVWCYRIRQLLKDFFLPKESKDLLWMNQMEELLEKWLQSCSDASFKDELELVVVRDYILKAMTESSISHRFLAGMVNFCTMMPMRAIPFRIVCLLGMNDGAYPRSKPPLDFDLMSMPGCYRPGDRSRREDDRYLFLEALLSAREKLYISYIGRSVRDNSQRVPSVLVGQLRDYIASGWQISDIRQSSVKDEEFSAQADYFRQEDSLKLQDSFKSTGSLKSAESCILERITTQHPLQPFSRSYFKTDPETRLFTYAHEWRSILDA
ncbi:MAG: exodeoxyribonuclease V subunit gamma, partial [Desulfamplus sp.]|nr:exodeoxyribonuclease V subunit gamma [Desulfamplus sp.]